MGKLEEENRKIVRRTKLQEAILVTIASSGRRGSSALIPEVLNSLLKLDIPSSVRKSEVVRSTASRLTKKGLIKFENKHYSLTEVGEEILEHWRRADFSIKKPRKWDNKWRIVIFDIPERKRTVRDEIRQIFIEAGFVKLQNSVWVYPYDCEDIIGLLKTDYGVGRNVLYIIADQIENDKYLRDEFGLLH
ncbi:MAG: hypothetical protein Q7R67_01795 [bacterium]|nr:hypothetical protein [bacterium]